MKKIALIILVLLLIFVGFILIKKKQESQANEPTAFVSTESIPVHKSVIMNDDFEYFQAKVEAIESPKISTKVSGYIRNINIKENQEVKKGDILVKIDDDEYQESIKQLVYSLQAIKASIDSLKLSVESLSLDSDITKKQYQTNQKLYEIGGISKEKLDISEVLYEQKKSKYLALLVNIQAKEYEYKSLQAAYNSKKALQKYYTLEAPINAKVERILLDIGDITNPNQAILTLISHERKLTFSFASNTIKPQQEVYINKEKIGFIEYINPSSENFLQVANIKLTQKLKHSNNSLLAIKVKVK